jgi:hypothetical protein
MPRPPEPLLLAMARERPAIIAAAIGLRDFNVQQHRIGQPTASAVILDGRAEPRQHFRAHPERPPMRALRDLREWASKSALPDATLIACYTATCANAAGFALLVRVEDWTRGCAEWIAMVGPDGDVPDAWEATHPVDFMLGSKPGRLAS